MATTQIVNVVVQELTKFGFKANDRFVNYSKKLAEADKLKVVPGAKFEAEYYVADSGKEYLNKVFKMLTPTNTVKIEKQKPVKIEAVSTNTGYPTFDKAPEYAPLQAPETKQADKPMTRGDWDNKDRRISRQGVIQAAVQALGLSTFATEEEMFVAAESLANKMLEFVHKGA